MQKSINKLSQKERDQANADKAAASQQLAKLQLVYSKQLTSKEMQELLKIIQPPDRVGEHGQRHALCVTYAVLSMQHAVHDAPITHLPWP